VRVNGWGGSLLTSRLVGTDQHSTSALAITRSLRTEMLDLMPPEFHKGRSREKCCCLPP
jgi:hypothetical protein